MDVELSRRIAPVTAFEVSRLVLVIGMQVSRWEFLSDSLVLQSQVSEILCLSEAVVRSCGKSVTVSTLAFLTLKMPLPG